MQEKAKFNITAHGNKITEHALRWWLAVRNMLLPGTDFVR